MELTVTVDEAQTRLAELLEKLVPGEEIWITKDQEVIAKLRREPSRVRQPAVFGSAKDGIIFMSDDFDAPLDVKELE